MPVFHARLVLEFAVAGTTPVSLAVLDEIADGIGAWLPSASYSPGGNPGVFEFATTRQAPSAMSAASGFSITVRDAAAQTGGCPADAPDSSGAEPYWYWYTEREIHAEPA